MAEIRRTRPVSWIKAALKAFEGFPQGARSICLTALTIAAEGGKAFQKKSTQGIRTPKHEIDLIRERLKRLTELLR
jgi:phage-related protein